jgi:hypothetical protein
MKQFHEQSLRYFWSAVSKQINKNNSFSASPKRAEKPTKHNLEKGKLQKSHWS